MCAYIDKTSNAGSQREEREAFITASRAWTRIYICVYVNSWDGQRLERRPTLQQTSPPPSVGVVEVEKAREVGTSAWVAKKRTFQVVG